MIKYPDWVEDARHGNYYADKIDVRPIMRYIDQIAELKSTVDELQSQINSGVVITERVTGLVVENLELKIEVSRLNEELRRNE